MQSGKASFWDEWSISRQQHFNFSMKQFVSYVAEMIKISAIKIII
jgi:hypothetical protein